MKSKLNPKQILLIVMSVLLVTVVILMGVVIGKANSLFKSLSSMDNNSPTNATEPSLNNPTDPTGEPDTNPTTAPTEAPTIPGHEHNFEALDTQVPTCTEKGFTLYTCDCGMTSVDFTDPKGHSFGAGEVYTGNCYNPGYVLYTCLNCGTVERQDDENPTHDYQFTQTIQSTCTDNYDEYVCTLCGDVKKENVIEGTGHNFSGWSPVEDDPQKEKRICVVCLEIEVRDIITSDWTLSTYPMYDVDAALWSHYAVVVTHKTTGLSTLYHIYIGTEDRSIACTYDENGLTISYQFNGETVQQVLPPTSSSAISIYSDGTCIAGVPGSEPVVPSEPTEPTDPSEPSEPTEPSLPTEN